jgi:uncharacterized protein YqgV (UPF0045/DUF77 family)
MDRLLWMKNGSKKITMNIRIDDKNSNNDNIDTTIYNYKKL